MKTWLLIPIIGLLLSACATTHPGNLASHVSGDHIEGMSISAEELSDPSKEAFSMISITVENKSNGWLRVEKAEVLIDEATAKLVSVVVGKDLEDWASAMETRAKAEEHNTSMAQLGLAAVGAVVTVAGAANNDRGTAIAGLGILGASQAWVVGDAITSSRRRANNAQALPVNHLYSPFSVPGQMYMRRWILLNKPVGKRLASLPIAITTVDGKREVVSLKLKGS